MAVERPASMKTRLLVFSAVVLSLVCRVAAQDAAKGWYVAHGWLMWSAFTVILPIGILIARLGRHGSRHWVLLHILTNSLAAALVVAGAIIAFVKFNIVKDDGWQAGTHPILGIFIVGFLLLQPILGLIRPKVGKFFRIPWYIIHFTIGVSVVGLAWYNIYLGLSIYREFYGGLRYLAILLGVQFSVVGWLYLLLNRYEHMQYQRRPQDKLVQNSAAQSEGYGDSNYETLGRDGYRKDEPAGSAMAGAQTRI